MIKKETFDNIAGLLRPEIEKILENYGFEVYTEQTTLDLRQALIENVKDGVIPEDILD